MRGSHRLDEIYLDVDAAITRCPACGRRVNRAVCPVDGPFELRVDADPETPRPLVIPRFPGYQVRQLIGCGGFGLVFEAEPEGGGGKVAIKLPRPDRAEATNRLDHEIAVLIAVRPPHVPALYASAKLDDGTPYVIMEHVGAHTLADRLLVGPSPIPFAEVSALGIAILRALEAIHACGYVHCDLKPENIFYSPERGATIVDFGLVVRVDDPAGAHAITAEHAGVGTAEYMSPEQCEGASDLDARADVYAVGVILYELVTGHPPFWGARAVVHESHLSRRPPRLVGALERPAVPASLEEVVLRCLAKDRRDRFESAAALRAALAKALADGLLEDVAEGEASLDGALGKPRASFAPPGRAGRGMRVTASLLFFEAEDDVIGVQARLAALGGHLGHAAGGRYVAVYSPEDGENPARRAQRAADELLREGLCARARVDLATVSVQVRKDGTKLFLSPLFTRADRFPPAESPPGLSLTAAVAAVLPDVPAAPPAPQSAGSLAETTPAPPLATGEGLASLAPSSTLYGRDEVLSALLDGARRALDHGLPTLTSIIAEPGYGKSHLAAALGEGLRALEFAPEVIEIRALEPAVGGGDETLRELSRRALEASDAGSDSAGNRLGEALRRRASARPLCVIVDDAHLADEEALAALEHAGLADASTPIWICVVARPSFEREHPRWGERAAASEAHHLGPLDPASAAALCRRLLLPAEDVPSFAVERLVARAEAIPLLLVELVRGLRRVDLVRRNPKGEGWFLAADELDRLPDLPLIEWLAEGELAALAPALEAHARLLALLGEEVILTDVEGVLGRLDRDRDGVSLPLDGRIGTQRLLAAGILVNDHRGHPRFRHALVREAIARRAPAALRRSVHLAAVAHLEAEEREAPAGARRAGAARERRLAQLAFHATEAEVTAVASRAHLELAERMRARHAYTDAERHYSRALELPGEDEARRAEAYRGRGLMRYRIARYHDALTDLSCARDAVSRHGELAAEIAILFDEATVLDWMDEYRSSEDRVEEARALMERARTPLLDARLSLGRGRAMHRKGREEDATIFLEKAAEQAAPLGDAGYETLTVANLHLGFVYQSVGRLDYARRALERVIGLAEPRGDRLHLGAAYVARAMFRGLVGERMAMVADFARARAVARELGQTTLELMAELNLGEALYLMDNLAAAEHHVAHAVAIDRRISGDPGRAVVRLLEARLCVYRGDAEAAGALVAQIRAGQVEARAQGIHDALMMPGEEVLCEMLELALAGADAAAWDALEERSSRVSVGQERIEVVEARAIAALRRGDLADARRRLERAAVLAARLPNVMADRLARWTAEAERED